LQDLSAGSDIDGVVSVFGRNHPVRVENVNEERNALVRVRYKKFNDSLILGPWIELALLTLITDGKKYVAHFVAREASKKDGFGCTFELKGTTNSERIDSARAIVSCYEGMQRAASNGPIPYFERASHELHKANGASGSVVKKLDKDLEYSAATNYFYGDVDPESIFEESATPQDYINLGESPVDPPIARAKLFAEHIWAKFEATTDNYKPIRKQKPERQPKKKNGKQNDQQN
jgi:hypothetical protein